VWRRRGAGGFGLTNQQNETTKPGKRAWVRELQTRSLSKPGQPPTRGRETTFKTDQNGPVLKHQGKRVCEKTNGGDHDPNQQVNHNGKKKKLKSKQTRKKKPRKRPTIKGSKNQPGPSPNRFKLEGKKNGLTRTRLGV